MVDAGEFDIVSETDHVVVPVFSIVGSEMVVECEAETVDAFKFSRLFVAVQPSTTRCEMLSAQG